MHVNRAKNTHFYVFRHLLFAPGSRNVYSGSTFPGLSDLLYDVKETQDASIQAQRWEEIKKHISVLTFTIQAAANSLKES